jgi:hypothetical protein
MRKGLTEYISIWCGLFLVGWYWNPLKEQATDQGLLWIQLWGLLILFLLSLLEGLRKQWIQWVNEGGWLHQHFKGKDRWDSWFIQSCGKSFISASLPFMFFWGLTGPWNVRGDLWITEWTFIQGLILACWLFFWIQWGWFWAVLKGFEARKTEWNFPMELCLMIPLALYTFFWICDPNSWWTSFPLDNEVVGWAGRWKFLGCFYLIWCISCPFLFRRWVLWLIP